MFNDLYFSAQIRLFFPVFAGFLEFTRSLRQTAFFLHIVATNFLKQAHIKYIISKSYIIRLYVGLENLIKYDKLLFL